jgi:hypothetical protein
MSFLGKSARIFVGFALFFEHLVPTKLAYFIYKYKLLSIIQEALSISLPFAGQWKSPTGWK